MAVDYLCVFTCLCSSILNIQWAPTAHAVFVSSRLKYQSNRKSHLSAESFAQPLCKEMSLEHEQATVKCSAYGVSSTCHLSNFAENNAQTGK